MSTSEDEVTPAPGKAKGQGQGQAPQPTTTWPGQRQDTPFLHFIYADGTGVLHGGTCVPRRVHYDMFVNINHQALIWFKNVLKLSDYGKNYTT